MSPFIALVVAGLLLVFWRAALALLIVVIVALVILGIVATLQVGQGPSIALLGHAAGASHSVLLAGWSAIG